MIDVALITIFSVWTAFTVLRFVDMYAPTSRFQRWRRWDCFRLVAVGAFFSPRPPQAEPCILVRDVRSDGTFTAWAETPRIRPRKWWHALLNPQKQLYRAKLDAGRSLLLAAEQLSEGDGERLPPSFLLSDHYLALLRYATDLERVVAPRATQFVVIEADLLTRQLRRTVLSSVHDV